jgi:hypothetical protein
MTAQGRAFLAGGRCCCAAVREGRHSTTPACLPEVCSAETHRVFYTLCLALSRLYSVSGGDKNLGCGGRKSDSRQHGSGCRLRTQLPAGDSFHHASLRGASWVWRAVWDEFRNWLLTAA